MLLSVKDIRKTFKSEGAAESRIVLDGVDLELDKGEAISILGPSGSGKSTLMNIIGALDKPDRGEVIFNGQSLGSKSEAELTSFRNREIGFVFQMHHLLPQCSVFENILIPAVPVKDNEFKRSRMEFAEDLLKTTGLWEHKDQKPGVLSGGECQRVALVRAMINQPKLILADEPTGSLDEDNALSVITLLLDLNKKFETSLIVVTHAQEIGNKMGKQYNLRNGKLNLKS
jgi:ABC-type lipoprotein export system ATPase subunit